MLEKVKSFTLEPALDVVEDTGAEVNVSQGVIIHDVLLRGVYYQACPVLSR